MRKGDKSEMGTNHRKIKVQQPKIHQLKRRTFQKFKIDVTFSSPVTAAMKSIFVYKN